MNPTEMLNLHVKAMDQKYGIKFPLLMTKEEMIVHCRLIDQSKDWEATQKKV